MDRDARVKFSGSLNISDGEEAIGFATPKTRAQKETYAVGFSLAAARTSHKARYYFSSTAILAPASIKIFAILSLPKNKAA